MIEIVDSFEANSGSDVKSIAENLGIVFPPDFADFLLLHNGGKLFHAGIFLENEWWKVNSLEPIQRFSAPGFWGIRMAQDTVPDALKPAIVFGRGVDLEICLSCNGDGTVFFWHGHLDEVIETELSFTQFIKQLKVNPEADYWTGVKNGGAWGAAESGDWAQVESALIPTDINAVNEAMAHPQTILATAAACGRLLVVKNLLALGADPNTPGCYGLNAMHCAVRYAESCEILAAIVEAGGDLDTKNEEGLTPLMLCALHGCRAQVFQWLVSNGADTSIETEGRGDVRDILNRKKDKGHSPIGWKDQLRALDAAVS